MTSPVPAIDATGTALGATILTVLATPALSLLVLWRFRGAVDRSMRSVAGHRAVRGREHRPAAAPVPRAAPGPLSTLSPVATAVTRLRQAVGWYLAAGLTYALFTTVLLLSRLDRSRGLAQDRDFILQPHVRARRGRARRPRSRSRLANCRRCRPSVRHRRRMGPTARSGLVGDAQHG
jgi:hypothetical protein